MALIDRLRRAGGIIKNRLASATGALRAIVRRVPAPLRRVARLGRVTTPIGAAITAATFAPQIARGIRTTAEVLARGAAFVGGRRVVTAAAAGGVAGALGSRKSGQPTRPSEGLQSFPITQPRAAPRAAPRAPTVRRAPARRAAAPARRAPARRRRRIPAHGHRVVSTGRRAPARRKRATHRSPRHKGHKRVSFTTKDGRKVSFLSNPRARHTRHR